MQLAQKLDLTLMASDLDRTQLAQKFEETLVAIDLNRAQYAERADIDPGILSKLFPRKGKGGDRKKKLHWVHIATARKMAKASSGLLTVRDFKSVISNYPHNGRCPLCGNSIASHSGQQVTFLNKGHAAPLLD